MRSIQCYLAVVLILLTPALTLGAQASDDPGNGIGVVRADVDCFELTGFDHMMMASTALVDMNFGGNIFWHLDATYSFSNTEALGGFIVTGGLGYAIQRDLKFDMPYTAVWWEDTPIGGDYVRRTTYREEGTCAMLDVGLLEAGVSKAFLNDEYVDWDSYRLNVNDTIVYAGYRHATYYEVSMAMENYDWFIHGIVGFKDRTIYDMELDDDDNWVYTPESPTVTGTALGIEAGGQWEFFYGRVRYYADEWFVTFGLQVPLTFLLDPAAGQSD